MGYVLAGIVWRLQSRIPVLMVGDFSSGKDLAIAQMVSKMLHSSCEIIDPEEFDIGRFKACAKRSQLLVARCSSTGIMVPDEEVAFVKTLLGDHLCEVEWGFASMHYSS